MQPTRTRWSPFAGLLGGLVLVGTVVAVAAHGAATTFELTFEGTHEVVPDSPTYPFGLRHVGAFTSTSPFCGSGSAVDRQVVQVGGTPARAIREFTCADGSGSLTLAVEQPILEHAPPFTTTWSLVSATGRYAELHGAGTLRGTLLGGTNTDPTSVLFRATSTGFVGDDAVAPAISFSTAAIAKLRKPVGTYAVRLVLAIRDDVAENPVGFTVVVRVKGVELGRKVGTTASGSVSMKLRVRDPEPNGTYPSRVEVTARLTRGQPGSAGAELNLDSRSAWIRRTQAGAVTAGRDPSSQRWSSAFSDDHGASAAVSASRPRTRRGRVRDTRSSGRRT